MPPPAGSGQSRTRPLAERPGDVMSNRVFLAAIVGVAVLLGMLTGSAAVTVTTVMFGTPVAFWGRRLRRAIRDGRIQRLWSRSAFDGLTFHISGGPIVERDETKIWFWWSIVTEAAIFAVVAGVFLMMPVAMLLEHWGALDV